MEEIEKRDKETPRPATLVKRYGTTDYVCDSKVELYRDGKTYSIRKGILRDNCVCNQLSIKDLGILGRKINDIINKINNNEL